MADASTPESPLERAAEVSGPRATEAFSLLANETRLAILVALWEEIDPFATDPTDGPNVHAIPFSELRRRVGVRDSGQFNYHLDKLVGRFVEKTEDGFKLHRAGAQLVRTVIASTGFEKQTFPSTEIDAACSNCGAASAVTYQNHTLIQHCTVCAGNYAEEDDYPDGLLNGWGANPAVLSHPSAEAIYTAGRTAATHAYAQRFDGICPTCTGRVERHLHVCKDHDVRGGQPCPTCRRSYEVEVRFVCSVCKAANRCSPIQILLLTRLPEVAAFFGKQGIVPQYPFVSETPGLETEQTVESVDPLRIGLTTSLDESSLQLLVDEDLAVVEAVD